MYTALAVFLRAMLLSQMYVNDDFMHPCFHHRLTSESSIHVEQTLKFNLWATSVCVCLLFRWGRPCKTEQMYMFKTLLCRNPEENKTTMTSSDRKCMASRCASDSRCTVMWSQAWLSVIRSNHWTTPPANSYCRRTISQGVNHHDLFKHVSCRWCQKCHACSNQCDRAF